MSIISRLSPEARERIDQILRELRDLSEEQQSFIEDHATFVDVLIDAREDADLPPYTADELETLRAECDANADELNRMDDLHDELMEEYASITGGIFPFIRLHDFGGNDYEHRRELFRED